VSGETVKASGLQDVNSAAAANIINAIFFILFENLKINIRVN
jgi:hypothetical protein